MATVIGQLLAVQGRNLLSVQIDFTCRQSIHTAENIQKRGLTGTGRTDNNHQLAFFHFKGCIMERIDLHFTHFIGLANIMKLYKSHNFNSNIY